MALVSAGQGKDTRRALAVTSRHKAASALHQGSHRHGNGGSRI